MLTSISELFSDIADWFWIRKPYGLGYTIFSRLRIRTDRIRGKITDRKIARLLIGDQDIQVTLIAGVCAGIIMVFLWIGGSCG